MLDQGSPRTRDEETGPLVAVVGPCASGKSTLVERLEQAGYNAREVNQEHSYVPSMWQRFTNPDLLIYLDVSQEVASRRRRSEAEAAWWGAMRERLRHAMEHADLRIDTDGLTPEEVVAEAVAFLDDEGA